MKQIDLIRDDVKNIVEDKQARILAGGRPRVVDLFSGCGGLSLGFLSEGFEITAALEKDKHAAFSHALNFHSDLPKRKFDVHAAPKDITKLQPKDFLKQLEYYGPIEGYVDVIVGGPPCQAYTRVGRAKLREVARHPLAYLEDPRRELYLQYLNYVRDLLPLALLMENVPDALNQNGHNMANEVCEVLEDIGYVCRYTLLNTVHYGVPQTRERMFLIAYRSELGKEVVFPSPTHHAILPKGYHEWRKNVLKPVRCNPSSKNWFVELPFSPDPEKSLPFVTVKQAIEDLPVVNLHLKGKLTRKDQKFSKLFLYPGDVNAGSYAFMMRNWCGFESKEGVWDHVIRNLPRDWPIFRIMNPGDTYEKALECAQAIFIRRLMEEKAKGYCVDPGTENYQKIKKEVIPTRLPTNVPLMQNQ